MKLKPQISILIVLLVFISGIVLTSIVGIWSTKEQKQPDKLVEVQYSGAYDPSDIRGSYTFKEISKLYLIPLDDLAAAFGVPLANASDFKRKDLESLFEGSQYEVGTGSVKMFTAYYLGLPYEPTEETYLPDSAASLLNEKGGMTQEQNASSSEEKTHFRHN